MILPTSQLSEVHKASEAALRAPPRFLAPQRMNYHHVGNSPAVPARSFPTWWIHLWAGLVRDPTAKHYNSMGSSIWLYLFLLISANRTNGVVLRKLETICEQTGYPDRTVSRWLQDLRDKGYITSTSNGRSLRIVITKWRPITASRKARP